MSISVTNTLAATLYQPRCGRCNLAQGDNKKGWRFVSHRNEWDVLITSHRLCPACVVEYDDWIDTPPPTEDIVRTHDQNQKGELNAKDSTSQ